MQESRAVISWEDGSIRSTTWLADDGSQAIVDRMVDAVAAIVNQRCGERCADQVGAAGSYWNPGGNNPKGIAATIRLALFREHCLNTLNQTIV